MDNTEQSSYQYVVTTNWKILYSILCLASLSSSLIIPVICYQSKKSRHHPAGYVIQICRLLVGICICEMICSYHLLIWAVDLNNFMHYFDVYQMANIWSIGSINNESADYHAECWVNQLVYFLFLFMQFNLYIILCIDLIITLQRPFISGKQRMAYYIWFVILVSLILLGATYTYIQEYCYKYDIKYMQDLEKQPQLLISYPPVLLTEIVFYVLGIISIVMAINNHRKTKSLAYPAMAKAKDQYIKNHITLVVMIFVLWLVPFVNNIFTSLGQQYTLLNNISFAILLGQGIFLGLVRMQEDYFRMRLKVLLLTVTCQLTTTKMLEINAIEDADLGDQDTWNFSLAALMGKLQNQDLIKSILLGIDSILRFENSASAVNQDQFPMNVDIIYKWAQMSKQQRFMQNATRELIDIQSSLSKSSSLKRRGEQSKPLIDHSGFRVHVQEHAPKIFHILRKLGGISQEQLHNSLNIDLNVAQIGNAQESMGKSGAFFFFSYDHQLILKTISERELKVMVNQFLHKYALHVQNNPESLIARCYGAFTVIIEGVAPVHLVLMENTLGLLKQYGGCIRTYDLKGSLTNRFVTGAGVMKDVNFMESTDLFMCFEQGMRDNLIDRIKIDTEFLCGLDIMDYSLLVGIAEPANITQYQYNLRALKDDGSKIISISLIDYLQLFDILKVLEYRYKTLIKYNKSELISCVMPKQYLLRFNTFINQICCAVVGHMNA